MSGGVKSIIKTIKELGRKDLFAITLALVAIFMVVISFIAWAVLGKDINQVKDLLLVVLSAIAGALRPGGAASEQKEDSD